MVGAKAKSIRRVSVASREELHCARTGKQAAIRRKGCGAEDYPALRRDPTTYPKGQLLREAPVG